MLHLGFYQLLRQSEIVNVSFAHYHFTEGGASADALVVPRSKTDQAGKGERIPLTRHIPVIGDIRHVLLDLRELQLSQGANA
jgi:hypothetical protein